MSDISQALRDTENSLRDLISGVLATRYAVGWEANIGVTTERIERWEKRRENERSRMRGAPIEERLLYYSDFYDLWDIVKKHWDLLCPILGERKVIEVWLGELERLRDPNAHNRDLLPYQKNLVLGISGDIRARIVRYRSRMEHVDDYFPKIESARDSVGHSWTPVGSSSARPTLRVGDSLDFVVTAADPQGGALEFGYYWHPSAEEAWFSSNCFALAVGPERIGKMKELHVRIRSSRRPMAKGSCDDFVMFHYDVLPEK